ncbi:VOC family protein [Streptomyces sp. NBC_00237]|uniref:VOC family protein n=1 Tax=Streptomyces sp. NBC_00237 TaxID=2975687 RepID=UPI0022535E3C|nr:VOC family protein [Streptomyces sp. NBC_00237]MCX5207017.1 VOC family protein [Streptomyces sp. NBC_00237]
MTETWPQHLDVGAVRFARPTARYDDVLTFYRDDVELPVLAAWRGDTPDEHSGVVFGLPGAPVHMEITQHGNPPRIPEPHPENLIALYLRGPEAVGAAVARMRERGHEPVEAANAYWPERGAVTYADPDGWLVVLAPWVFGVDPVPTPK